MSLQSNVVTIPDVKLTLDQLLIAIRQLDEPARIQVAQVLLEAEMDNQLAQLIRELASKTPIEEITDADIEAEIKAVRQARNN